jgi:hypothetical protein
MPVCEKLVADGGETLCPYNSDECCVQLLELKLFYNNLNLKSSIFWNVTPCSPIEVPRRLGGIKSGIFNSSAVKEAVCSSETSGSV